MENSVSLAESLADGTQDALTEEVSVSEISEAENSKASRRRKRRQGSYWKQGPSRVYPGNFGFVVNGYQPMIDYLDAKDSGLTVKKGDVHLPYINERCMRKYSGDKPFKFYTNPEIDGFIQKGNRILTQIRQNDAVCGGNALLNRTHTKWSMTKKWVQLVKNSNVCDYRKLRENKENLEDFRTSRRTSVSKRTSVSRDSVSSTLPAAGTMATDILSTLAHSKLDHEQMMASRRDRLQNLDDQFEQVVTDMTARAQRLYQRPTTNVSTPYDKAETLQDVIDVTDDIAMRNKLRRQAQLREMMENVNEVTQLDSSKNRLKNSLRRLDDEIMNMNDRIQLVTHRQRQQRDVEGDQDATIAAVTAEVLARKNVASYVSTASIDDSDIEYLKKRKGFTSSIGNPHNPERKRREPPPDKLSDVQARILNRAGELSKQTSETRRINSRARFINVCTPRRRIPDPEAVVTPTRTEINIDYMAQSLASSGRAHRRYDVDEEITLPVSGLNTYASMEYCTRETSRPVDQVPSNSRRVRLAEFRARARNTLLYP